MAEAAGPALARLRARPELLFGAATTAYLANCGLGAAVALGRLDTRNFCWLHHLLYINTSVLTAAATSSLLWSRNRAGWTLLPAAVPLAVIPYAGTHSRRHIGIALSAAPFFLASLVRAWR